MQYSRAASFHFHFVSLCLYSVLFLFSSSLVHLPILCTNTLRRHTLFYAFTDHCCIDTPTLPHFKIRFYCNLLLKHKLFLPFFFLFIFTHSFTRFDCAQDLDEECIVRCAFATLPLLVALKKKNTRCTFILIRFLFCFSSSL